MSNSRMPSEERGHLQYLRDVHARNQNNRCYFCGVEMTPADVPDPKPPTMVTIEHLKGRRYGGGSNYLNTAASCLGCNNERSSKAFRDKTAIPVVRMTAPIAKHTHGYTTAKEPFVLVLHNTRGDPQHAMLNIRKAAGQPLNFKFCEKWP